MSDGISIIKQDWDDLAIEDGSFVEEFSTYSAKIHPRDSATENEILESKVESIRYSPEVNSAPSIQVDVEPFSKLEGDSYIGGNLSVFVNEKPLFSGEIVNISLNQNDEYYTIKADSFGRQLKDEDIEETPQDKPLIDYLGYIIDGYNGVFYRHDDLVNTSNETLNNLEKASNTVRSAENGVGTVQYSGMANAPTSIDSFYFKCSTNDYIDVRFYSDGNQNDSYTIQNKNTGTFGDWIRVENVENGGGELSVEFELSDGSILYDWVAIPEEELIRDIDPVESEIIEENVTVQSASSESEFQDILPSFPSDEPIQLTSNGNIETLQVAFLSDAPEETTDVSTANVSDSDYSGGSGIEMYSEGDSVYHTFDLDYTIPNDRISVDVRYDTRHDPDRNHVPFNLYIDGNLVQEFSSGSLTSELDWFRVSSSIMNYSGDMQPGTHEIEIEIPTASTTDHEPLYIDIVGFSDDKYVNEFDNSVHEANGYLNKPYLYPEKEVVFDTAVAPSNIRKASIDTTFEYLEGNQDLQLSFGGEGGIYYPTGSGSRNTDNIVVESDVPESTLTGRVIFRANPVNQNARSATPRYGYRGNILYDWHAEVDIDDTEILFGETFSGNRLKILSDVADDSRVFYRWEGKRCKIFQKGERLTNPNLRKEKVESEINIEDVYSSCEVKGANGISSGVIESNNSPAFIDRHKTIRDPDIELEQDAKRKARSFLIDNSSIEYKGKITTLPTRAPLGEMMDGSVFSHGKDSYIQKVNYGKRRSKITFGQEKNLQSNLLDVNRSTSSNAARDTR